MHLLKYLQTKHKIESKKYIESHNKTNSFLLTFKFSWLFIRHSFLYYFTDLLSQDVCKRYVPSSIHPNTSPTIESWETIVREEIDSLKQIYDKDLTEKSSANDAPIISIFVPADYSATSLTSGNLIISYLPNYPQTMYFTFSFLSYANITTL